MHGLLPAVLSDDVFIAGIPAGGDTPKFTKLYGAGGTQQAFAVAVSPDGQSLSVVGRFNGELAASLSNPETGGVHDPFLLVVKPSNGELIWGAAPHGDGEQRATSVTFDSAGDIILSGVFAGSFSFPDGTPLTSSAPADENGFVVKLDGAAQGKHLWSHSYGDEMTQFVSAIAADAKGYVWAAGAYQGALTGAQVAPAASGYDAFLLGLTP